MKIGLIDPGSKKIILNENFPHLGLAFLAAVLEKYNHEVKILDLSLEGEKELHRFLGRGFDMIGLSATSFTFSRTVEWAKRIKELSSRLIIVVGGPHVPIGMETVLDSPWIDYAVCGEGEMTMLELVSLLQEHPKPGSAALSSIQGLLFRQGDRIRVNPLRPRIENLDELPYPAFHLFSMEKYGIYPLLTSRGCPFGCTFCSIKAIWGTFWSHRSPENIIAEIEHARRNFKWGDRPFSIIDDSFNIIPKRIEDFSDMIAARGLDIKWFSAGFRADHVSVAMARKMKKAGCIGVSIGIESANNDILTRIKKKTTSEAIQ